PARVQAPARAPLPRPGRHPHPGSAPPTAAVAATQCRPRTPASRAARPRSAPQTRSTRPPPRGRPPTRPARLADGRGVTVSPGSSYRKVLGLSHKADVGDVELLHRAQHPQHGPVRDAFVRLEVQVARLLFTDHVSESSGELLPRRASVADVDLPLARD